ncbi:hypothetical protein Smp_131170 [Schistosoma mansoni]|uniref:Glycosyl transferase n=1 Tax=Schistosoma mansoni TaxID=6183 RepID=G4VT02_SCHMA|nr:hypothetical protein Smp_131170 [Schistosoma mansoni]|eukprot:XP_018654520.1 hypothetical protein Smp_131170 [Schistosoma mansoni]
MPKRPTICDIKKIFDGIFSVDENVDIEYTYKIAQRKIIFTRDDLSLSTASVLLKALLESYHFSKLVHLLADND